MPVVFIHMYRFMYITPKCYVNVLYWSQLTAGVFPRQLLALQHLSLECSQFCW